MQTGFGAIRSPFSFGTTDDKAKKELQPWIETRNGSYFLRRED
jgi:hypothetical protein